MRRILLSSKTGVDEEGGVDGEADLIRISKSDTWESSAYFQELLDNVSRVERLTSEEKCSLVSTIKKDGRKHQKARMKLGITMRSFKTWSRLVNVACGMQPKLRRRWHKQLGRREKAFGRE